jgi:hypothetical protein
MSQLIGSFFNASDLALRLFPKSSLLKSNKNCKKNNFKLIFHLNFVNCLPISHLVPINLLIWHLQNGILSFNTHLPPF